MRSFVVNQFSDSVALETKSFPWLQLIPNHWLPYMLLSSWNVWTRATFLPALLCSQICIKGPCSCLKSILHRGSEQHQYLQSRPRLPMGPFVSPCSSFLRVGTCSVHSSQHRFQSNCGLWYFWGGSAPNSNEISHHTAHTPYNASHNVPSTSSTQFRGFILCLSSPLHIAVLLAGKERPLTRFKLNPDECVQHVYPSGTERSHPGRDFSSSLVGAIPQTTCQTSVFAFFFFLNFIHTARLCT